MTSRPAPTILVHEWVTGGGLAGSDLPPSWAAEGAAMRRAIAREFAAVARVTVTLDARLPEEPGPWAVARIAADDDPGRLLRLARAADLTILVAPETMGILEGLTRRLRETGTRLLGSTAEAVALAGDKVALAGHLASRGIETPPCRVIDPRSGLPRDAVYPAVVKPIDGAGAVDTFFVESPESFPEGIRRMDRAILQPFLSGRPMSASFLVGADARAGLLGIGEQAIAIRNGRFAYEGGRIPVAIPIDDGPLRAAVESVPGLRGFVGVDFVRDEHKLTLIEINPRPTTSIVALIRLLPPGRLASAWIGALEPGSESEALLAELAGMIRARPPIAFDASGEIRDAGGHG